ncbi:hypothetical protein SARC_02151 [Sphaeroforma arctica JP610]|uniref:Uncharacterized protein n=1 Tax=Sphaeroforma arctica JP610 TaxID=667725 RepID=A0A0L0G9H2_9EUKA|nr:hypothetical protein SARC_02151 [Sphaeroforma arctica JP610]KNC85667.1 hypothetical protein SARC_02151 [Sphaeroforma arctica JP610]|eukprot:XP_014159569.1 hypothetical protein SARC_02151 [Sphaeroforma arctica JP610]
MGDENINTANAPQVQNRVSGKQDTNDPLGTTNDTSSTRIIPGNDVDNGVFNRCTPMDDDQEDSAEDDDDEDEEEEDEKDSDEGVVPMVEVNSGISPDMQEKEDTQSDSAIIEDPIYSLDVSDKVLVETISVEAVSIAEERKGSTSVVNATNGGEKAIHDDSSEDEDEDDNMNERDAENVKLTSGGSSKSENLTGSSGKQPVTAVTNTMAEIAGESSEDEGEDEDEDEDEDMQVNPVQSRAENDGDDAADDLNGEKVKDVEMKNTDTPDKMEDSVFEEGNQGEDKSPSGTKPNVSSAENHDMRPTSVDGKAVDMDMNKDTSKPNEGVGSKTSAKTDASGYFTSDGEDDDEPTQSATAKVKGTSHSTPVDSEADDTKDQGGETRSSKESARGKGAPNVSDGEVSGDEASHARESSGDTRASVSASKIDSHRRRSKNTRTKASKSTRKTSTDASDSDAGDMANGTAVPAGSSSAEEGDKESVAAGAEGKATQKKREFANDSAFNKGLEDGLFGGSSSEDEPLPSVQQARIKVDQNQLARDHQRMIRSKYTMRPLCLAHRWMYVVDFG